MAETTVSLAHVAKEAGLSFTDLQGKAAESGYIYVDGPGGLVIRAPAVKGALGWTVDATWASWFIEKVKSREDQ